MRRWETSSTLEAEVSPVSVWEKAYADAGAWPAWNAELKSAEFDGPLAPLWRRGDGPPRAAKTLPDAQQAIQRLVESG